MAYRLYPVQLTTKLKTEMLAHCALKIVCKISFVKHTVCIIFFLLNTFHYCVDKINLCLFQDYLQSCLSQIEEMVTSTINTTSRTPSEASGGGERSVTIEQSEKQTEQHGKAGTPTDVRDIHF